MIEEGPPGAVLHLDDPQIRIVADLPRQIGLHVGFGLFGERKVEHALARMQIAPASSEPRRRSTATSPST